MKKNKKTTWEEIIHEYIILSEEMLLKTVNFKEELLPEAKKCVSSAQRKLFSNYAPVGITDIKLLSELRLYFKLKITEPLNYHIKTKSYEELLLIGCLLINFFDLKLYKAKPTIKIIDVNNLLWKYKEEECFNSYKYTDYLFISYPDSILKSSETEEIINLLVNYRAERNLLTCITTQYSLPTLEKNNYLNVVDLKISKEERYKQLIEYVEFEPEDALILLE